MSKSHLRVKQARALAGLTQLELSVAIGVSRPAVSQWEKPQELGGTAPERENAKKFAEVCDVSLNWLLTGEGLPRVISHVQQEVMNLIPDASANTTKNLDKAVGILERAIEENALKEDDVNVVIAIIEAARNRNRAKPSDSQDS